MEKNRTKEVYVEVYSVKNRNPKITGPIFTQRQYVGNTLAIELFLSTSAPKPADDDSKKTKRFIIKPAPQEARVIFTH